MQGRTHEEECGVLLAGLHPGQATIARDGGDDWHLILRSSTWLTARPLSANVVDTEQRIIHLDPS
jgi:hypothetical protein